jgi:hypothetical protein
MAVPKNRIIGPRMVTSLPPPEIVGSVTIGGRTLKPLPDDRVLPPLLCGIYSQSGKLIDIQTFADPRARFCCEVERQCGGIPGKVYARPLVADESADALTAGKLRGRNKRKRAA